MPVVQELVEDLAGGTLSPDDYPPVRAPNGRSAGAPCVRRRGVAGTSMAGTTGLVAVSSRQYPCSTRTRLIMGYRNSLVIGKRSYGHVCNATIKHSWAKARGLSSAAVPATCWQHRSLELL